MHNNLKTSQHSPAGTLQQESIFIPVGKHQLHMKRFCRNPAGQPVWMVHGSIEDGRIFYSSKGKGLAPFLAAHGYDVFVADLRGRGKSTPPINKYSQWGLSENLREDFPAYIEKIREIKGAQPQHWMAHSWGGVLQLAYLARYQSKAANSTGVPATGMPAIGLPSTGVPAIGLLSTGVPASITFFGTKRRINTFSLGKLLKVDIVWNHFSKFLIRKYGYLPGKKFGIGSESESALSHQETQQWVVEKDWRDWRDGFDYREALQHMELPPILSLTGAHDKVLGHPEDVRALIRETGSSAARVQVVGKAEGFMHDYDHINLLTHPDVPKDHFRLVLEWLESFQSP